MRLLAAHTVIKANLRSCQRQCSHCLIETIPYLLFSNKGIREQAKLVSFSTYLAPHEPRAHTVASLRGKDRVFVLHQNEKGRNEKAKSQITEGLIPFLKAVSSGGKQRERRRGKYVSPICNGGLFLCVNSSTPFNF